MTGIRKQLTQTIVTTMAVPPSARIADYHVPSNNCLFVQTARKTAPFRSGIPAPRGELRGWSAQNGILRRGYATWEASRPKNRVSAKFNPAGALSRAGIWATGS